MKKYLAAYFEFTRAERTGIAVLLCLLLLLVAARITMAYWTDAPAPDGSLQAKLTATWEMQKSKASMETATTDTLININTADSVALLSLDGVGPALTHRILERRRALGSFRRYEEVWAVYHFNEETKKEILARTVLSERKP